MQIIRFHSDENRIICFSIVYTKKKQCFWWNENVDDVEDEMIVDKGESLTIMKWEM